MSSKAGNSFKNFGLRSSSSRISQVGIESTQNSSSKSSSYSSTNNISNNSSISSSSSVKPPGTPSLSRPGSVSSMVGGAEPSFKRSSAPVVMGGGSPKMDKKSAGISVGGSNAQQMARISQEQASNNLRQTQSNLHISERGGDIKRVG